MPNIKSVAKDVIRSRQRQLRNQATKSQIKTYVKKSKTLIADSTAAQADVTAVAVLDFIELTWPEMLPADAVPRLRALSRRANALPAFAETRP